MRLDGPSTQRPPYGRADSSCGEEMNAGATTRAGSIAAGSRADRLLIHLGRRSRSGRRRASALGRTQSSRQDGNGSDRDDCGHAHTAEAAYQRERGAIDGVKPIG